jgi:hypothetical protein
MNRRAFLEKLAGAGTLFVLQNSVRPAPKTRRPTLANGPLRVHPHNPRYFTDGSGKAIYLAGSHHWNNFQDEANQDSTEKPFDYLAYLDLLQQNHHNCMRLWVWEQAAWASWTEDKLTFSPMPYFRTGPGTALDGLPKFDLTRFDPAYFQRLRNRILQARNRGIYVCIMLFQGWSIERKNRGNPWPGHPFNGSNNVNGINGDANGNGEGEETQTLRVPAVTKHQKAYLREIIDAVNDLDNVLYEITNESPITTQEWQYQMVRYIHQYEVGKPKQHPVGMSYIYNGREGAMDALLNGPADWVSVGNDGSRFDYGENPLAAKGRKVLFSDTDHIWGEGGDRHWVWKSFLRGLNPIFMDRLATLTDNPQGDIPGAADTRKAMGQARRLADRMNLAAMAPHDDLASTRYCLANPGTEYLAYAPDGGEISLDLTSAEGQFTVEWVHPVTGVITPGRSVQGGTRQSFKPPYSGDVALHIVRVVPKKATLSSREE